LIPALAREAQQAGATLSYDTRFLGIGPNARGLRLEVESGGKREELHADSVVGADGAASRVARASGWPPIENRAAGASHRAAAERLSAGYDACLVRGRMIRRTFTG